MKLKTTGETRPSEHQEPAVMMHEPRMNSEGKTPTSYDGQRAFSNFNNRQCHDNHCDSEHGQDSRSVARNFDCFTRRGLLGAYYDWSHCLAMWLLRLERRTSDNCSAQCTPPTTSLVLSVHTLCPFVSVLTVALISTPALFLPA